MFKTSNSLWLIHHAARLIYDIQYVICRPWSVRNGKKNCARGFESCVSIIMGLRLTPRAVGTPLRRLKFLAFFYGKISYNEREKKGLVLLYSFI